jgi:hypothetical protein
MEMDEKQAMVLVSIVKDLLIRAIDLALEVESQTGLKVVSKDYLSTLYTETMRQRDWQKSTTPGIHAGEEPRDIRMTDD